MTSQKDLLVSSWPEWEWFDAMEALLVGALSDARQHEGNEPGKIYPFLDSTVESLESLRTLANQLKLRDSYVIARMIYETAVNACFLLTDPEKLTARANTHAKQKALRNLVRAIELAGDRIFGYKMRGAEQILENPQHQEWLKQFTSKSGREVTSWTPENVQQRVEAVYLKFGANETRGLAFGLLLYRHASEIAHGTLFGTLFSWGAMEPGAPLTSSGDIGRFRRRELRHLLKLVSFSLESFVRVVALAFGDSETAASAGKARSNYYRQRGEDA